MWSGRGRGRGRKRGGEPTELSIVSPERHPCVMAEPCSSDWTTAVIQLEAGSSNDPSALRVAADVNSNRGPKSAVGVEDWILDESVTDWLTLLGDDIDSDSVSDVDNHDIDTDVVYAPIPCNAASEPAANEDISLQDQVILLASDQADDAALREIAPNDLSFDFRWQNNPTTFTGQKEIFTGPTPGPTFPITKDTSPVDIFSKIFNTDFLDRLVTETNRNARQTIHKLTELGKIPRTSRVHRWTPTNRDEMVSFLAIMILQDLYPLPNEECYFKFNGYGTMPYMRLIMSYNRLLLLKMFFNFVDNDSLTDADKKLGKIQPILDYFNERFSSMYNLTPNIVIDESLLRYHGRLGFSQKIKSKVARVGRARVKTYELSESSTGYLWRFFVHTGKSYSNQTHQDTATEEIDTSNAMTTEEADMTDTTKKTATMTITTVTAATTTVTASTTTVTASSTTVTAATTTVTSTTSPETRPIKATAKIVYNLIEPLLNRGHVLIMDNLNNCPLLARCLKRQKTDCYGTLRLNREFVPDSIKTLTKATMRQGEVVTSYCEDLAVMVWRDANIVSMITTCHSLQVSPHQKCDKQTYKPDLLLDYNKSMEGVDRKNQLLSGLPMELDRHKVWYKKLFRRLYSVALFNCFVLYHTKHPQMTHRSFRQVLAEDLLRRHRQIDLTTAPSFFSQRRTDNGVTSVTATGRQKRSYTNYGVFVEHNHFPVRTGFKQTKCYHCARRKVLSRTVWKCEECEVNLCIETCFKQYHKIQKKNPTVD